MRRPYAPPFAFTDGDHAEFDEVFARVLRAVCLVVVLDFFRGHRRVAFHHLAAHCGDDHLLGFGLFELLHRETLRQERALECAAVTSEFLADDRRDAVVYEMLGDGEFLLLKFLQGQLPVDEVVDGAEADFFDLFDEFVAFELIACGLLDRTHEIAHLGEGDNVIVHDSGDAIEHFLRAAF